MAILIECICHNKQSVKNKKCSCGQDLDKLRRGGKARYWISFRADGKQRRECVGTSIADAQAADGKRKSQKKEGRIFDMVPGLDLTMGKVIENYLELKTVKKLGSYPRVKLALSHINKVFGKMLVRKITTSQLNNYCSDRLDEEAAESSVTKEIVYARAAVRTAVNDNLLDFKFLQSFMNVGPVMKTGDNARERCITIEEYLKIIGVAPFHVKTMVALGYNCGMRRGEILGLRWSEVDLKGGFIHLPRERTKENKPKSIPINHHVHKVLKEIPRAIHHDFVITNSKGDPLTQDGAQKVFVYACDAAGVSYGRHTDGGMTFHDMRGSWKMNAIEAGIDPVYRNAILGHAQKGMDKHYISKRIGEREDLLTGAMAQYTEWLDAKIEKVINEQTQKSKS